MTSLTWTFKFPFSIFLFAFFVFLFWPDPIDFSTDDYEDVRKSKAAKIEARNKTKPAPTVALKPALAVNPSIGTFDLFKSDSYKGSHGLMLQVVHDKNSVINTQFYVSARKGSKFPVVTLYGLQYIMEMLGTTILTFLFYLFLFK